MGVELSVPKTTSLLDACNSQPERYYGYDCVELEFTRDDDGVSVAMTEREQFPTAGRLPHLGCLICTASDNALAILGKGHRPNLMPVSLE